MLISRRSTLATAAATAALATTSAAGALAYEPRGAGATQRVQTLLIHQDESGDQSHSVALTFASTSGAWFATGGMDGERLRAATQTYQASGFGLRRINAFQTAQGVRHTAIWQSGHQAPAQVENGMTLGEFESAMAIHAAAGLTVAHVDACATVDGPRFAAIWDKSRAPQRVFAGLTAAGYKAQRMALGAEGYRPRQIAGYAPGGQARFAAVFVRDGAAFDAQHAVPAAKFPAQSRALLAAGFSLKDASGYVAAGRPFYTAVWERA
ncbi:MAG: hypothetical protein WDM91_22190 [Rhizomicrobium sp.]